MNSDSLPASEALHVALEIQLQKFCTVLSGHTFQKMSTLQSGNNRTKVIDHVKKEPRGKREHISR